jgi:chitinase
MKTFLAILLLATASISNASTLFFEDFESGLDQWSDAYQGFNAQTVADPSGGSNKVLNFTALRGGGDLFSTLSFASTTSNSFILEFDYLGTCGGTNCGGFIGVSANAGAGSHTWLGGTTSPYPDLLPDTGVWEHVSIAFSSSFAIHLMLEDWSGSGGVAGDAYFDNILLTDANGPTLSSIPVPAAVFLFAPALIGFMGLRRKVQATIA